MLEVGRVDMNGMFRPLATVPCVLLFVSLLVFSGCRDFREAYDLRRTVRDELGWEELEIGFEVSDGRVVSEITAMMPGSRAAPPVEENARILARLARESHHRVRRSDRVTVSFQTREEWLWGTVERTEKTSWTFPGDSL